jgi:UDP-perosamine 4-acetyltransferase
MSLIVLCAGGHARVVIEALLSRGKRPSAVTDCDSARVGTLLGGIPIIGPDEDILKMKTDSVELANGLGNRASRSDSGLSVRRDLFHRFTTLGYAFPVISHASAVIASDALLGEGTQVMAGAIIQPAARIGRNVLVNTRAVVEHDCQVGDHCHIAPGAVLCGGASIGERVHIGAGAVVLGGVSVGTGSVVAAGAVVEKNVEAGRFAGGDRE